MRNRHVNCSSRIHGKNATPDVVTPAREAGDRDTPGTWSSFRVEPYTELEPVTQCEQITNSLTLSSACRCSFASRIHMMKMTRVNILKLGYIGRGGNEALSQTTPQGHPSAMVKMAKKIEGGPPTCHHHHMAIQEINRAHELMSQLHAVLLQLFPAQVGGDILKEILTLTSSALSGLQSIRCESSGGSDDDRRCASDKRKSLQRSDRPGDHKRR